MSPEEQQIVQFGRENGKSKTQVKAAIASYRKEQQSKPTNQAQTQSEPFLRDVGTGAAKGLGRTALGVASIGRGIQKGVSRGVDAVFGTQGFGLSGESVTDSGSQQQQDASDFLKPQGAGENIGSLAADVATFAVPGAAATRATKGAGLLKRAATLGATDATVATAKEGQLDRDAAIAGGVGAALPIGGAIAAPVLRYGGSVLKGLAGTVSGTGQDVIERALANPGVAKQGLRASDEQALKQTATAVRQGVKTLKQNANAQYADLTSGVSGKLDAGTLRTKVTARLVDDADARVTDTGLSFKNTPLLEAEEKQLEKIFGLVNEWDDFTPQGVNTLATRIGRFRRDTQDSAQFDRIVDNVRRDTRSFVGEQFPEIAEANAKFASRMDLIDDLDSILKTRGAVESQQGVRETSQRIARLFNSNKELSREAVELLEKDLGIDVLSIEAGRQLSDNASLFQVGAQDTGMGIVRSLIPRQVIGEMVVATGQSREALESALGQNLQKLDAPSQAVVVEMMLTMFGDAETQQSQLEQPAQ